MIYQFEIMSSTPTKKGNFCNKIVTEITQETRLGLSSSRRVFYIFTDRENTPGNKASLDLALFNQVSAPFTFEEEGEEVTATLTYLYPKG